VAQQVGVEFTCVHIVIWIVPPSSSN